MLMDHASLRMLTNRATLRMSTNYASLRMLTAQWFATTRYPTIQCVRDTAFSLKCLIGVQGL
jgi:hypothetical protein